MKKMGSLLLAMVMVFVVTILVSANEITERLAIHDYARETSPTEREMLLDRHIREFEDDADKQEAFLAAVTQRESAGAIIDNRELSRMAREIKNVPNGNGGFHVLGLSYTALGNLSAPNSVWNNIISNLPVRNSSNKGSLYVSNAALKIALNNALTTPINKYWNVN